MEKLNLLEATLFTQKQVISSHEYKTDDKRQYEWLASADPFSI